MPRLLKSIIAVSRQLWETVSWASLRRLSSDPALALAGLCRCGKDRGQVHGPHPETAVRDVATFVVNHVPDIAACDFYTVPTVTFRVLYVFILLRHDRLGVRTGPRRWREVCQLAPPYEPKDSNPKSSAKQR